MSDMFVKIDGIAGESKDEFHPNEIEVSSWRWKMEQLSSLLTGASTGAAKETVVDLQFVHQIDRSSPDLMRYCLTGSVIHDMGIERKEAPGTPRITSRSQSCVDTISSAAITRFGTEGDLAQ
ncbi:hypothetical protein BTH42_04215 [Burkholderia sp. SRS-W-2-2016]|uniref:type VI secretion system tube protein Hcp n=1 Tax=Burkholderia sp. SRS-W-2-2016 TaxID=1926878 RepID=UPI00094ABD7F|nr:type VI secretion system tube protein Hcp [Burkholderia sp. SRS-W-2-2016]OLL33150.1 hypothetical protein BTH42_04215 [Burkholderia sp. SRS-W-2-2016]